jgi:hypothetical protein
LHIDKRYRQAYPEAAKRRGFLVIKPTWALAGVAFLGIAGGIGVLVASSGGQQEVVQQVETATPEASAGPTTMPATPTPVITLPSSTLGATLNYTDPIYGYSFDYPSTWYLSSEGLQTGVILYSYDPAQAKGIGRVPSDKLKAFFWVAEGVDKPLDQWLAEGRNNPGQPPPPTIVSTADVTLGGKAGLIEVVEDEGARSTSYYLILGGGRVFVVNAGPSDSLVWPEFVPVLASLRFAP